MTFVRDFLSVWPIPPRRWREIRRWVNPACLDSRIDVAVWCHEGTAECNWVVLSEGRLWSRGACAHPLHWGVSGEEEWRIMGQFVKKVVDKESRRRIALDSQGSAWVERHPAIWEYLTLEAHEDGTARQRGMLMAFVEDGVVKVCMQDRDNEQSLWVSAQSLPSALEVLEGHLQGGTGDWRRMKGGDNGRSNKKGTR